MSGKKPATMDEFLKISQSKRTQTDKEKKKKEKDKDKGKAKEPSDKKPADKKSLEPAEPSPQQPSSKDIFALLEETDNEAQAKIKNQIMDVVQGLVQAYGEIPISRIAKRISGETEERVVSVLEDLIIAGAIKARLSTDKIIPIEGTSKISIDKASVKGKPGPQAPSMAEEIAKPEGPKPAGRSKSAPPEPPKLVAPSLEVPPSFDVQKPQKGSKAGAIKAPPAVPRVPSIPTIAEPPSLSFSRGKQQAPEVDVTEIPDFPNPEPSESEPSEIPIAEPMDNMPAPESADLEEMAVVPTPPVVPASRVVQKPAPLAPKVPVAPGMKPGLKPMKVPAPKPAGKPAPAVQIPMAPKVPAITKPMKPGAPTVTKPMKPGVPAMVKPAVPKVPAVPPAVPTPPVKPPMKPAAGMKPVKPVKAPAVPVVPTIPQAPRIAQQAPVKKAPAKPAKPASKEDQAALFEQKVNELLQDHPEELSLVYKLFENPKLALLGFDEDWIAGAMGITAEHAVELIKYLRGLNIVKLGPSGLNFVINTNL
ncbi:MAG TPA: hypothetical protein VKM55_28880 [Candidatus Lokiarchaeia archaeon]|nr:hypothetical protein [Candidatus Lokiarchaeia archaeon]